MSYALNAVTAPDAYSPASTIENVPIQTITLDVTNQAIYWQLKIGLSRSTGVWEDVESQMLPGSRQIASNRLGEIVGIRFRAAIPAASLPAGISPASVSVRTSP